MLGADNAVGRSFDRKMIIDIGLSILADLEAQFTGNQKFEILNITEDELILYFDEVVPIPIKVSLPILKCVTRNTGRNN